jgi:arrestin-related trafficking adapter 4/5/7
VGGEGNGSSSKSMTLPAGNYEWPFELVIPGSTVQSVEGLEDVHVIYKLKATVARGRLSSDLHAYKPVRIIRTLDPAALELAHAMTVENVWPNKVEYSLVIPQKAVIFGTSIQVEMQFTPLLKGLKLGKVKCELMETHDWMLSLPSFGDQHWKKSRDIATWIFEMNEEEHYQNVINEDGQDGWVMKDTLLLPKSLKQCMQDVETPGIKIRHKVKFTVALENPDGHTSEVSRFAKTFH